MWNFRRGLKSFSEKLHTESCCFSVILLSCDPLISQKRLFIVLKINLYLATEEKRAENFYEEKEPQSNQCQVSKSNKKKMGLHPTKICYIGYEHKM